MESKKMHGMNNKIYSSSDFVEMECDIPVACNIGWSICPL